MECLVQRRLVKFLNDNDKLNPLQQGFRQAHSCQTQLLETINQLARTLDHGTSSHVILLDFAKALDSVPHQGLLLKVDHIGVRGELQRWIRAFLTDWQQRVVCNGCPSAWTKVTSGGIYIGTLVVPGRCTLMTSLPHQPSSLQMTVQSIVKSQTLLIALSCKKISQGCTPGPKSGSLPWTSANVRPFASQVKKKSPTHTYRLNNVTLEWVDTSS